jgi:hypothetical protein
MPLPRFASWLLCVCATAAQAETWRTESGPVPDAAWRKSVDGFAAMLLVTDRHDEFVAAWTRPPTPSYRPEVSIVDAARRGQTVHVVALLSNCTAGADGRCRVLVDVAIDKPDGSVYALIRSQGLWMERPAPRDQLVLGKAYVAFEIEPDDPLGTYRIVASVRDQHGGHRLELERTLVVTAKD